MRPRSAFFVLPALCLLPALTGCVPGAVISPQTPLELRLGGTYEGVGAGVTGRVPYRLVLSLQEREGRATGVLTNLESRKAYALSGRFQPAGTGGTLDANLYENGDQWRATLRGTLTGDQLRGTLRTVLLGQELLNYAVTLDRRPVAVTPAAATAGP